MSKPTSDCRATERKHPWPMVRLGDVCNEIKDRIQSSKIAVDEYVTTDNMVKDRGGIVQAEYVPSDVGLVEYHKGDVLIANIRPYLKKIWLADHDGGCSSDVVVFRTNIDGLSSEYLYSVLSQDAYFEYVMQKPRGTKMPRGDRDWMKEFCFPLPSLTEQKEIVARLERELAAVEKMKKGFEALAETAQAEFEAELKEVFEELAGKMDGQARSSEQGHLSWRELGEVCDVRDGTHDTPAKCDNGYLLLTSKNVRKGKVDKTNAYCISASDYAAINKRSGVDQWDVLFSMIGTVGETAIVDEPPDFAIKNMGLFKTHADELLARWIKYYFDSPVAKQLILDRLKGSNQKFLSLGVLRAFPLALTDRDSMLRLVTRIDAAKVRAEKLEAKAREGVAVCETMRKAILKEAFE